MVDATDDRSPETLRMLHDAVHAAELRCDRRFHRRRAREVLIHARIDEARALAAMGFTDYSDYVSKNRARRW